MRLFFAAAAALLMLVSPVGAADKAAVGKPLVVGMELAYPPVRDDRPAGQAHGRQRRPGDGSAKALGRPVVIENIAFDGLIPALKTGKVDRLPPSMTATAERAQSIDCFPTPTSPPDCACC